MTIDLGGYYFALTTSENDGLHFHPRIDAATAPAKLVLRLKTANDDVRANIPLAGAGAGKP